MIFLQQFQKMVRSGDFSKACLWLAGAWLLILHPALLWFYPGALPPNMKPAPAHLDTFQYYAGAVVVREQLWDSLYPVPKREVFDAPSNFTPEFRTFLYDPARAATNVAFYPEYNCPVGSDWPPRLKQAFPEALGFGYIYPPPTALLCAPLGLFEFDTTAMQIWPIVSVWFLFVLTFFASQIYRVLRGGDSYGEGIIALACLGFAVGGPTDIPLGNVTPILAGCVACCRYALLRCRMLAFSCAYIPLVLFKAIGLVWLPLLVLNRAYWRALMYLAAISLVLNAVVLQVAGFDVYQKFFSLLPLISIPVGPGIKRILIYTYGFYPAPFYLLLNFALLALLYFGYLRNGDRGLTLKGSRSPLVLAAFLAGTLAVFCLLNNVVWPEYAPNYLFLPLLGWMMQEANLAKGPGRFVIPVLLLVSYLILIGEGPWICLAGGQPFESYDPRILTPYAVFVLPAFFLIVALRRLLIKR